MTIEEHERLAHEMLDQLRREYELRAQPYIEILSQIHAMRMPAIVISFDSADRLPLNFELKDVGR